MKRKKLRNLVISVLVLLICAGLFCWSITRFSEGKRADFLYCLDGDSMMFKVEGKEVEVRLLSINCPEISEEYGIEARDLSRKVLSEAEEIRLVEEERSTEFDKYGRRLYWVYADGELLQKILLENGLAKVDYVYGEYDLLDELRNAELEAEIKHIGLWKKDE